MYWNYRVVKELINNEETFSIKEVYYNDNGDIESWCNCHSLNDFRSLNDLKNNLKKISKAFTYPILININDDFLKEEKNK